MSQESQDQLHDHRVALNISKAAQAPHATKNVRDTGDYVVTNLHNAMVRCAEDDRNIMNDSASHVEL